MGLRRAEETLEVFLSKVDLLRPLNLSLGEMVVDLFLSILVLSRRESFLAMSLDVMVWFRSLVLKDSRWILLGKRNTL